MDRLLCASQTHKIRKNYQENLAENTVIEIKSAKYINDYKINISFNNKEQHLIDFEPFLRNSLNPLITTYLDLKKFKKFSIKYGDLMWNDYDLCFPVIDLYEGNI